MGKFWLILVLLALGLLQKLPAQNTNIIDSLENRLLGHQKNDTIRVKLLNNLAKASIRQDFEKAIEYVDEAIRLADSLKFYFGKSTALFIKGRACLLTGKFPEAIQCFHESADLVTDNRKALVNTLENLAYSYYMIGNTSKGLLYFNKVLQLNKERGHKPAIAKSYNNLGNFYQETGQIDSVKWCFDKAIEIWTEVGDSGEVADVYVNLGYFYNDMDHYYKGLEAYQKALLIYEKLGNKPRIALALNGIGNAYATLDDHQKASSYYMRALDIHEEFDEKEQIAYCLGNLATLASKDSNFYQALKYYNRARYLLEETGNKPKLAIVLNNMGICYKAQEDYERAIEFNNKALAIYEELNNESGKGSVYLALAGVYFEQEYIDLTEEFASSALEIAVKFNQLNKQQAAHELLYQVYEQKKDYQKALEHHKSFKEINDSLFNEEKIRKITGLEYKYQFEKEKQAFELEQQKKDLIQAEEIRRQKILRNAFILGFLLVLLLALVILRSYLQKRMANRKLREQNNIISKQKEEKELLIREIHHRVKNNLQIISSLFDLQMRSTENPDIRSALIDGLNRVKSVGLLHQLLYRSEDVINIDFRDFVTKLLDHITSYASDKPIEQNVNIQEGLHFDIETTIPLGLIITELLTNAFKYAFEEVDTCRIAVILSRQPGDQFRLEVQDNGKGLPEQFDIQTSKSLGLRVVRTLAAQLKGRIDYKYQSGAKFILTFAVEDFQKDHSDG